MASNTQPSFPPFSLQNLSFQTNLVADAADLAASRLTTLMSGGTAPFKPEAYLSSASFFLAGIVYAANPSAYEFYEQAELRAFSDYLSNHCSANRINDMFDDMVKWAGPANNNVTYTVHAQEALPEPVRAHVRALRARARITTSCPVVEFNLVDPLPVPANLPVNKMFASPNTFDLLSNRNFRPLGRKFFVPMDPVFMKPILEMNFTRWFTANIRMLTSNAPVWCAQQAPLTALVSDISRRFSAQRTHDLALSRDLTPSAIRDLSTSGRFPPCATALMHGLAQRHHLKHPERFQITSFLKGIGTPVENTSTLLRQSFVAGGITEDKFRRDYAYSVRHVYGLEGSRKELSSMGCGRVQANRTARLADGCPFMYMDVVSLQRFLREAYGVTLPARDNGSMCDIEDANGMVHGCVELFYALVKRDTGLTADEVDPPMYPVQWYNLRKAADEIAKSKEEEVPPEVLELPPMPPGVLPQKPPTL